MLGKPKIPEVYEECSFEEATHVFALLDNPHGSDFTTGMVSEILGKHTSECEVLDPQDLEHPWAFPIEDDEEFLFVKHRVDHQGLPTDPQERKGIPIYSGFVKYFPDAMAAVSQLSFLGNEQHHPGTPLHWDKDKSQDELDALMRHLVDSSGGVPRDTEGVLHEVKVAWRAMANLQRLADKGVNIFAESTS